MYTKLFYVICVIWNWTTRIQYATFMIHVICNKAKQFPVSNVFIYCKNYKSKLTIYLLRTSVPYVFLVFHMIPISMCVWLMPKCEQNNDSFIQNKFCTFTSIFLEFSLISLHFQNVFTDIVELREQVPFSMAIENERMMWRMNMEKRRMNVPGSTAYSTKKKSCQKSSSFSSSQH